jgi:hypothetical protein
MLVYLSSTSTSTDFKTGVEEVRNVLFYATDLPRYLFEYLHPTPPRSPMSSCRSSKGGGTLLEGAVVDEGGRLSVSRGQRCTEGVGALLEGADSL